MGKHCNNSQCFFFKYKAKLLINSILKKIKDNFRKKILKENTKKGEKIMLEALQQFMVFCDESYSASPHDLTLFAMTF